MLSPIHHPTDKVGASKRMVFDECTMDPAQVVKSHLPGGQARHPSLTAMFRTKSDSPPPPHRRTRVCGACVAHRNPAVHHHERRTRTIRVRRFPPCYAEGLRCSVARWASRRYSVCSNMSNYYPHLSCLPLVAVEYRRSMDDRPRNDSDCFPSSSIQAGRIVHVQTEKRCTSPPRVSDPAVQRQETHHPMFPTLVHIRPFL